MGLTAPWGEGKTSVLNLLEEELGGEPEAWRVIHFNPWLFADAEQLTTRFLTEFADQLHFGDRQLNRAAAALRRYRAAVAPARSVPGLGGAARVSTGLASLTALLLRRDVSAEGWRARVRKRLAKSKRRVLVIVDDLDRLGPEEVADVVRLMRLVGDFPNVTYLVAFDRAKVEAALGDGGDRAAGRTYLEKVVQVMHDLPPIGPEQLDRCLNEALSEAIGEAEGRVFDRKVYEAVYRNGFRDFFGTVRDVRRFANALASVLALVGDEVELSDVLALEALRLFDPQTFEGLMSMPDVLGGVSDRDPFAPKAETDAERKALDAILANSIDPKQARQLLVTLFPIVERYLSNMGYGRDMTRSWRHSRRVAHPQVLAIYLRRALPAGVLPSAEVARAARALGDRTALRRLMKATAPDTLPSLLTRLQDYEGRFGLPSLEVPIEELLRLRAERPPDPKGVFSGGLELAISQLMLRLLDRQSPDEVTAIVRKVQSPNLSARADLVGLVGHIQGLGSRLVSKADGDDLEQELVADILAADAETIAAERDGAHLLVRAGALRRDDTDAKILVGLAHPTFLRTWLRGATMEIRGEGLRYQLNWPSAVAPIGHERLAEFVHTHETELRASARDRKDQAVIEQALIYADDYQQAEEDMRPYGRVNDEAADDE